MSSNKVIVYFVHCKYLYQLMIMFNITNRVNWADNGSKILLYKYYKIEQFDDIQNAIKFLCKWDGNQITKKIGRSVLRIGDIFKIDNQYYLFVCKKLVKIPQAISKRLLIYE